MSLESRTTRPRRFSLVAIATFAVAGALLAPATENANAATSIAVESGHPKLLVEDAARFTEIRDLTDPASVRLKKDVLNSANYQLTLPAVAYEFQDESRMTTVAKTLVDRAYTLTMAWHLTGDDRYIERLWVNLDAASRFPDWNPDHFLDTAEFANAFAISYDWAYGHWTDARRQQLRQAILTKAIRPASDQLQSPGEDWVTATHNRNVVSNSGIGLAALSIASEDTSGDAQRVLGLNVDSIQNGLKGYLEDGSYAEGPMYWEYATDYATTFLNALQTATGSTHGLEQIGGLLDSGTFMQAMSSPAGDHFTFGDSEVAVYPALSFSGLSALTGEDALESASAGMETTRRAAQRLVWRDPSVEPSMPGNIERPTVANFAGVGVSSLRGDPTDLGASFAALKWGADPTVGHRQVDVGDVMIAAGGTTWIEQLGLDRTSYAALGNGAPVSSRWDYYRNRLDGHNTVTVRRDANNDFRDSPGGTILATGRNGAGAFAVADLSASQGLSDGAWIRGIRTLSSARQVILQDEFTVPAGGSSRWAVHTSAEVKVIDSGRSAILYKDGRSARIDLNAASGVRFRVSPALPPPTAPNLNQDDNSAFRKLVADVPAGVRQTVVATLTALPAEANSSEIVPKGTVLPLKDWSTRAKASIDVSRILIDGKSVAAFSPSRRSYTVPRDPALPAPSISASTSAGASIPVTPVATSPGSYLVGSTSSQADGAAVLLTFVPSLSAVVSTSASSTLRGSPAASVDGNESTGWATRGDQYLDLTMQGAIDLHRIDVLWTANSSRRTDFRVLTQSGGVWVPVASGSFLSASGWSSTSTALSQSSSKIRIEVKGDPDGDRTSTIRELRVFGFAARTPPPGLSPGQWSVSIPNPLSEITVGEFAAVAASATGAAAGASFELASSDPKSLSTEQMALIGAEPGSARFGVYARRGDLEFPSVSHPVEVAPLSRLRFLPSADAFVEGGTSIDRNFGSATRLDVKASTPSSPADGTRVRNAYLRFDLSGLDPSRIGNATLVLPGSIADSSGGDAVRVDAREVTGGWTETGVTYRSRPTLGDPIGSGIVTRAASETKIDLTKVLQETTRADLADFDVALGGSVDTATTLMARFGSLESDTPPRIEINQLPSVVSITGSSATGTVRGTAAATHDGNTSSGWAARAGAAITWNLSSDSLVKTVSTEWSPDASKRVTFKLSTSLKGSAWTHGGTYTYSGGPGKVTHTLPYAYRADRLRLELVSSDQTWQGTLREISLKSPGIPADPTARNVFADATVALPESMAVGTAASAQVSVTDVLGEPVPAAAVTYRSDRTDIAAVSATGRLSAVGAGTASITVTVSQGGLAQSYERSVTTHASDTPRLLPQADTFVEGGASSATVFGTKTRIDVKPQSPATSADGTSVRQGYLTFDLRDLAQSGVLSARLEVTGSLIDDPSRTETRVYLHAAEGTVDESRTTYSNRLPLGAAIGSFLVTREVKPRQIDVTEAIQRAIDADEDHITIALGGSVPSRLDALMTRFSAREAGEATSPRLIIERVQPSAPVASVQASYTLRGSASSTVDGDYATGWATRGDQTLTFALGSRTDIGSLRLLWSANASRRVEYEVAGTSDGKTWRTIYDGAYTGPSGWESVYLPEEADVTHIRLVVHGDPAGDTQSVLREALLLQDAGD